MGEGRRNRSPLTSAERLPENRPLMAGIRLSTLDREPAEREALQDQLCAGGTLVSVGILGDTSELAFWDDGVMMTDDAALRRGTNQPRMGDFNQSVVLEAIRRAPQGLSRVELAEGTGLSAQAVTNITRRLLEQGLVVEAGRTIRGPGKPRTMLRLDPTRQLAIGVHLDPAVMTFVLLDLAGEVIAQAAERTPTGTPRRIIDAIVRAIEELIVRSGVDRTLIVGVGVASPGPLDVAGGTVIDPPKLAGWHRVPLRDAISAATGLPLLLEKDTTAAAVAELWRGSDQDVPSFLFVYLGTGIGVGLVRRHEIVRGSSGNAGEVGHIIVDPDGPLCGCGLRGCLGVVCTPQALVERAEHAGVLEDTRLGSDPESVDARFDELCRRAAAGDTAAQRLLDRNAEQLSVAISALTNMLDIDRVVFGGPYWSRLADTYLRVVPQRLQEQSATCAIRRLPVAGTVAGDDVAAIGAACAVLDAVHSPHTSSLYLSSPEA